MADLKVLDAAELAEIEARAEKACRLIAWALASAADEMAAAGYLDVVGTVLHRLRDADKARNEQVNDIPRLASSLRQAWAEIEGLKLEAERMDAAYWGSHEEEAGGKDIFGGTTKAKR